MRSSWEASATNRRSRCSDAVRAGEGALDVPEHGVEGQPEPPHLGAVVGPLHPPREIAGGDLAGGRGHLVERAQADPHDPQREEAEQHDTATVTIDLDEHEPTEGLGHVAQRQGDDEVRPSVSRGGERPVAQRALALRPWW